MVEKERRKIDTIFKSKNIPHDIRNVLAAFTVSASSRLSADAPDIRDIELGPWTLYFLDDNDYDCESAPKCTKGRPFLQANGHQHDDDVMFVDRRGQVHVLTCSARKIKGKKRFRLRLGPWQTIIPFHDPTRETNVRLLCTPIRPAYTVERNDQTTNKCGRVLVQELYPDMCVYHSVQLVST